MSRFLKCDAADCDHVETMETITADLIGKPCPKCGANLLTELDYAMWVSHVQPTVELMKGLGLLRDSERPGIGEAAFKVNFHDGQLITTITIPTQPDGQPK